MGKPASEDLRIRVVTDVLNGETCEAVGKKYSVATSSAVKWTQLYRRTGSVAPAKIGGYRQPILEPHLEFILDRIEQVPHLTLHGLKNELATKGVMVSHDTVWRFLRAQGLSFKKKPVRKRTGTS